jgi:peptide/nickel transport system substrate-binding protein
MKKLLTAVLVLAMVLTLFAVRPMSVSAAGFGDVPATYWAKDQIDYLVSKGVVAGYPDGTFKPETPVTREQFAKMICIAKGLKELKPATATFKDVASSAWSYGYVEAAVKAGYIKGYSDGTFGPTKNITRQELAVLGVRVLGKEAEANAFTGPALVWANDLNQIASWAVGAVTLAYRPDIQILTYRLPAGVVAPTSGSTRAECAYAIYKIMVPPQVGGTVVIAQTQEPDALPSWLSSMMAARELEMQFEDSLVYEFPNGTVAPRISLNVPNFADGSWKVYQVNGQDYMQTTFHLRKGVKWSDGVPVDYKADAIFAVGDGSEASKAKSIYLSGKIEQIPSTDPYDKIEKIEFPDPYTMVITWNALTPYAEFGVPLIASHYYSKVALEDLSASDLVQKPIALGPYMVKTWAQGAYISEVPNPNWFGWAGSKPLIQEYDYKWYPDTNTMLMNVQAGACDVTLIGLGSKEAVQAQNIKTIKVQYIPSSYFEHFDLNVDDPILSDVNVRKAIAYGLNYQDIINRVHLGVRKVDNTFFFFPGSYYCKPNTYTPGYDPAKAKQLLDAAGWVVGADGYRYKNGKKLSLELSTTTRQDRKDSAVVIQAEMKDIGIEIVPKFLSSTYFFGTYCTHRMFQIAMFAWGGDPVDPSGYTIFGSDQIPTEANGWAGQNYTGIVDKTLNDAFYNATHNVDPVIRQKNYYVALQRLTELLPEIPLNWWVDIYTPKTNLAMAGFQYSISSSLGYTYNSELWYWEKK